MELREVPHKGDRFLDSVCIGLHYFNINEGAGIRKGQSHREQPTSNQSKTTPF